MVDVPILRTAEEAELRYLRAICWLREPVAVHPILSIDCILLRTDDNLYSVARSQDGTRSLQDERVGEAAIRPTFVALKHFLVK